MTTTANSLAAALRVLADHFEKFGDRKIETPELKFNHLASSKEHFLADVQVLPHPLQKDYGDPKDRYAFLRVTHQSDAIKVEAIAMRSSVCRMISPAMDPVYECEPLLSASEEALLTGLTPSEELTIAEGVLTDTEAL